MYKFVVIVFLLSFTVSFIRIEGNQSVFEKTFNFLHKEPPPPLQSVHNRENIPIKWIQQKLDNFNDSDSRTWMMRYMENEKYFQNGGPMFIFVGGEWSISSGFLKSGLTVDMAKEHKGYLFYTEHRYYGESFPTKNLTVENLKYLSVEQSLADLAHFIATIKKNYPGMNSSKVILIGGSYSATMVTWFQRVYPGIAVGSWASSAPLRAKVDFTEYKEITGQSITLVGGKACHDRILNSFKEMEELIAKNQSDKLMKLFNICDNFNFTNKLDRWSFFGGLSDVFAGLVQTHTKGKIDGACSTINSTKSDLEGIVKLLQRYLGEGECNDFSYEVNVKAHNYTQPKSIMRQWMYQTCTEFGWYQTSGSKDQPFGSNFPVELYTTLCRDIYGERFSNATIYENVLSTNRKYGEMNPNVKNVISTHGQLDPWRAMGIQASNGESHVIPLYAHCKDFDSITSNDSKEMKASKEKVLKAVRNWLS